METVGIFHVFASALALGNWLLAIVILLFQVHVPGKAGWPEAMLVLTVTLATTVSLSRQLPAQNVALAAAVIALMGGAVHLIGAATGIPFGPFTYLEAGGPRLLDLLAWPIPLVWVIVILNARGVARLILRPWRKLRSYGFWLIGVTAGLTVLFEIAFEPFAVVVKHYWLWRPTRLPWTWGGAPVTNYFGWLLTALLILAFATPALIDKRRERPVNRPPDYHPLITWLLLMGLFCGGEISKQLWAHAMVTGAAACVVAYFAVRGARW